MKLKLNKKQVKSLSADLKTVPELVTPKICGALPPPSHFCDSENCTPTSMLPCMTYYCI